ncbi:pilus assembly protein TadG-related protein [Psychromarinibacter halotolerans]|uniref:Pilus assembly protein TadG-related protein n=1 Tax=Psychromarinibacter halotolerans TaxID=1775175 RepID=A0ABV7GSV3_9RHOB|nr:pilus assembly protein TadG-related protein [Psychromarinibacter halotolerans]MDF0598675.1 pilus assembly protein TadG-related protein [Psychromarinibacter halotolerans]
MIFPRFQSFARSLPAWLDGFRRREDGAMTLFGLYIFLASLVFCGLAVDVGFAYKTRTELQVAADSAAHAALFVRQTADAETARAAAVRIAEGTLSPLAYGDVLLPEDVQFGYWDNAARVFTPDEESSEAVLINTAQLAERSNAARAFLLNFVGIDHWDVNAMSVFTIEGSACANEGFIAQGRVDMQSNNTFKEGFCVHSNSYVHFNNNNTFEPGVNVSMPDLDDLDVPNMDRNWGLIEALREQRISLAFLDQLGTIIDGLEDADPEYTPDYITNVIPVELKKTRNLTEKDFTPGRIHTTNCSGGGTVSIKSNTTLTDIVLVTDCDVTFGSNVTLENVVVATRSTDTRSVSAAASLQLGRDDGCAEGGGAEILTLGGFRAASKLTMYGGKIIAAGDVDFAAQGDGGEGASIVAGGEIDGTSNTTMGVCGAGMGKAYITPRLRLAG